MGESLSFVFYIVFVFLTKINIFIYFYFYVFVVLSQMWLGHSDRGVDFHPELGSGLDHVLGPPHTTRHHGNV